MQTTFLSKKIKPAGTSCLLSIFLSSCHLFSPENVANQKQAFSHLEKKKPPSLRLFYKVDKSLKQITMNGYTQALTLVSDGASPRAVFEIKSLGFNGWVKIDSVIRPTEARKALSFEVKPEQSQANPQENTAFKINVGEKRRFVVEAQFNGDAARDFKEDYFVLEMTLKPHNSVSSLQGE